MKHIDSMQLKPGEFIMKITEKGSTFAFGNLFDGDGNPLLAEDNVCIRTAAIHRSRWGRFENEIQDDARLVVCLTPARPGSTFPYFAQVVRVLSVPERSDDREAVLELAAM